MAKNIIMQKAKKIKVIATDVDGVLTDGHVLIDGAGNEPYGKFTIHDGIGVIMAHDCGIKVIVISGRKSLATEKRCKHLGIDEAYTGVTNKSAKLRQIAKRLKINFDEVAYIGDDIVDLGILSLVGLKIAPKDAVETVIRYVDYVTRAKSGKGVFREVVDLILQAQDKYDGYIKECFSR